MERSQGTGLISQFDQEYARRGLQVAQRGRGFMSCQQARARLRRVLTQIAVTGIAPAAIMKVVFEDIRAARGSAAHLEGVGSLDNWSVDFVAAMVEGAVGTGTRRAFRRRTGRAASAPARLAREPLDACYRRCESAQRWRSEKSRHGLCLDFSPSFPSNAWWPTKAG